MFGLIKKTVIKFLTDIVPLIIQVLLSNKKSTIEPTIINSQPNECTQGLCYHPPAFNLDECVGSCSTLNDLSKKACIPNKTEGLNLSVYNITTGTNESKILTKDVSCECKCKFDGRKCNSDQKWNNDTKVE